MRDLSICVLGNNRPLCPPSKPDLIFFFLPYLDLIIFFFLLLPVADWTGLDLHLGFKAWKQDFPALCSPYLSFYSPFPNLSLLHSCVYLYIMSRLCSVHWVVFKKQRSSKGMFRVFLIGIEAASMGGENLWTFPKTKESPAKQLTGRDTDTRHFFEGPKMESCVD